MDKHKDKHLIIYDGECGFCTRGLVFLAKADIDNKLIFVSAMSAYGNKLLSDFNIQGIEKDSIILIDKKKNVFMKSKAIAGILMFLPSYILIGRFILFLPTFFTDFIYNIISKGRHNIPINGCKLPDSDVKDKFIY